MSGEALAQELAVACVSQHTDEKGAGYIHVRSLNKTAVISVGLAGVHCPEPKALEHVRSAIVGLIEAGIEEGRRWQSVSPEALAAAREEGHEVGIAVGWARTLAVAVRMVESLQEREEMAKRELRRCTDELRVAEAIRNAISEASPTTGGYDGPRLLPGAGEPHAEERPVSPRRAFHGHHRPRRRGRRGPGVGQEGALPRAPSGRCASRGGAGGRALVPRGAGHGAGALP